MKQQKKAVIFFHNSESYGNAKSNRSSCRFFFHQQKKTAWNLNNYFLFQLVICLLSQFFLCFLNFSLVQKVENFPEITWANFHLISVIDESKYELKRGDEIWINKRGHPHNMGTSINDDTQNIGFLSLSFPYAFHIPFVWRVIIPRPHPSPKSLTSFLDKLILRNAKTIKII